jgi:hypothetical protein
MKNVLLKTLILTLTLAFALSGSFTALGFVAPESAAAFDPNWRLAIDGAVTTPLSLSISNLQAMGQSQVSGAIYCEGIFVADGTWTGVPIETLLQAAGADPTATNLEFYASDYYNINVSTSYALLNNPIIAYTHNGMPTVDALRLVLPDQTGKYWISLITEIRVTSSDTYSIGPVAYTSTGGSGGSSGGGTQTQPTTPPQPIWTPPPTTTTPTQPPVTTQPSPTPQPNQTTTTNSTAPSVLPTQTATPTQTVTPQPTLTPANSDNQSVPSATLAPSGDKQIQPLLSSGSGSLLTLEVLGIVAIFAAVAGMAGFIVFERRKSAKCI